MAFPTIDFNHERLFLMKANTPTDIHLSVATNTIGKSQLNISLTGSSCSFLDGTQDMTQEIETSRADELTEVGLNIVIQSTRHKVVFTRLIAVITNTDGESDKSRLQVKLDNVDPVPLPELPESDIEVIVAASDSVPEPVADNSEVSDSDFETMVAASDSVPEPIADNSEVSDSDFETMVGRIIDSDSTIPSIIENIIDPASDPNDDTTNPA